MILTTKLAHGLKIRTEYRKIRYLQIVAAAFNLFLIIGFQVFTVLGREFKTLVLTSLFYWHQTCDIYLTDFCFKELRVSYLSKKKTIV